MIRINLLPFRLARKKENIRRQVSVFFLSLVFIILALGWGGFLLNNEIKRTRNEVAQVKAESLKYKKRADQVSRIKKNLAILEDKLTIVENLKKRKNEQQILLEQLAQRLVKTKMWLSSVSADAKIVSLKGIAFDNTTIAAFMRNLESFKMFGSVDLKRSQTKVFDENLRLKEFEISCTKIPPEQTDEDVKSKKREKIMVGKKKDGNVKKSGQMDALFEKIGALTKIQRLFICLGTLGLIGAGFYFLLLGPKLDILTATRQDLENQKNLLSRYKIKAAALEKVKAQMAQVQEQFNIAMTALPDKRELPSLLDEISKAGRDAGLEVQLFAPQNMVNKTFYTEIPFSMTIAGRYHQMAEFFYRVAGLNRVVNISAINMNRMSGKDAADRNKIQMKCVAVTYMFVEPKEDGNTGKKGKKRRKKG